MSAIHNFRSEKLFLCTLLEKKHVRQSYFHHLHSELFGTEPCREICDRVMALSTWGHEVPQCHIMAEDPALSDSAKNTLKLDRSDREAILRLHTGDLDALLDQLRYFYKKRVVFEAIRLASEKLNTDVMINMEDLRAEMQASFAQMDLVGNPDEGIRRLGKDGNMSDDYLKSLVSGENSSALRTGFPSIDSGATWSRGNMIMLTAMRGHGKSVLVKSLGLRHFIQSNHSVFICSLEMEEGEYVARAMSELTRIDHDKFRRRSVTKEELERLLAKRRFIDERGFTKNTRWTLRTVKSPSYTPTLLHQELKHQGYDVVVVDYINLFKRGKRELWDAIYDNTKYLKMMAKDLNVLLYVVGQLNEEGRAKYAKAAEEDADAWLYWEINPGQPSVKFFHGKARHYRPFSFKLIFDGKRVSFLDPTEFEDPNNKERDRKLKDKLHEIRRDAEEEAANIAENMEELQKDRRKLRTSANPKRKAF